MTRAKAALGLFAITSIISFIAALIPFLKGGRINGVFLGSGVIFLAVTIANAKRMRRSSDGPPAA
jgi:hypothetical protein